MERRAGVLGGNPRRACAAKPEARQGHSGDEEQFHRIAPVRKQLLDTVKMIAYRAETAMAQILKEHLGRKNDVRPLLRQIYKADIDLVPDEDNNTLIIKLHRMTNRQADQAVSLLCCHLNETETIYPGTDFKMKFELVSN